MSNTKQYWNSLEQLNNDAEFEAKANNEFAEDLPVDEFLGSESLSETNTSRRDFLKFVGFSVAAATLAACEAPVIKSIPYVNRPEEIVPGVANYYASAFYDGVDFASVLVKTREGRPIHIEPNRAAGHLGSLNARVNTSVLSLYDAARYMAPAIGGEQLSWKKLDDRVTAELNKIKEAGGKIRLLTNSIISPTTKKAVETFTSAYGSEGGADVKHVTYDAYSYSGIRKANKGMYGKSMVPSYRFDKAKVVVSLDADFMSTWLTPNVFSAQFAETRNPDGKWMSKHFHFEPGLSLTGSNADVRAAIKPSEVGLAALELYRLVGGEAGAQKIDNDNQAKEKLAQAAKALKSANGQALVISGSNDPNVQMVVNAINEKIGAYNQTIDKNTPVHLRQGDDAAFASLVNEMKSGSVDALIISDVNPVYNAPSALGFKSALSKVGFTVSIADKWNETSESCQVIAPKHHFLESWNDYNPMGNMVVLQQPAINAVWDTRQMPESLLRWGGVNRKYYDFLRENWNADILSSSDENNGSKLWNKAVHDGFYEMKSEVMEAEDVSADSINSNMMAAMAGVASASKMNGTEAKLYLSTAMAEGSNANNPWLQELPDPVSKITWDNYIAMNPSDCAEQGFATKYAEESPADTANVTLNGVTVELPVIAQPGQKKGAVSIALGYGRTKAGKVVAQGDATVGEEKSIGQNLFAAVNVVDGFMNYTAGDVKIEATGNKYPIGSTQTHHTMMGRKIINETSLKTYQGSTKENWNPDHIIADAYGKQTSIKKLDLWEEHDIDKGHRWGLSIDLNACNGCGACVTACHSENNVPVVGKEEIRKSRDMHWLRIDRYYSSEDTFEGDNEKKDNFDGLTGDNGSLGGFGELEDPSANPQVAFQPVMCQHCNHAPCETVCPVAASAHGRQGQNHMTYNRCVGTRYCANNCPYKVRRFNWFKYNQNDEFDYHMNNDLGRMVLNPDVTVRARGVMEKCSMCIQMTQKTILDAKREGREIKDGEFQTACSNACDNGAIVFGDINDDNSVVYKKTKDDRKYHLLEYLGTKPNVLYQTKVRNTTEA